MKTVALFTLGFGAVIRDNSLATGSLQAESECDENTSNPKAQFAECVTKILAAGPRSTLNEKEIFKGCSDAGMLIGGLVKGVQDAGYMENFNFDENGKLTVDLTSDQLFGELATTSKVPVMWNLAKQTTFEIEEGSTDKQTVLSMEGVAIMPPAQGLAVYKTAVPEEMRCSDADMEQIRESIAAGTNVKTVHPCLLREMKAAGDSLSAYYKGSVKETDPSGWKKIDWILKATYGNPKMAMPPASLFLAKEWPKIFYSLLLATPSKITKLTFNTEIPKGVMATTEQNYEWAGEQMHGMVTKSSAMAVKSIADALKINIPFVGGGIDFAEGAARSGMAFAEMLAWGEHTAGLEAIWKKKPHMGSADALTNMFSWCEKGATPFAERTNTDDPKCMGKDIGRVSWAPLPSARMT